MNGLDQIIVNLNGDLVLIKAICKRTFVLTGISKELKLLDLTCKHCRGSIAELVVATVQLLKRRFTQDAIMSHKHWNVRATCQFVFLTLLVRCIVKGKIRIFKHGIHVGRLGSGIIGAGEKCFFSCRKRMSAHT